ncbi:1-aminocyclopropane-1-carboxylate oxidase -like protein 1 [Capsicum annuum]|nr:1-aminocyclopropane-1-carboxylate oxidase -like protein 1 [Capsicum annuum]KAF3684033.1 1-aminocyclopropane-1-carboxylate oxidase -like protein 1 [Capsicum annuum]
MEVDNTNEAKYDRKAELQAFDETKAGVKGLVDAGITKVPRIFVQPSKIEDSTIHSDKKFSFPVVDLDGIKEDPIKRKKIVQEVGHASETWGFFQVINHGIPTHVLEEMKDGVIRFFEEDTELKKQWYSRDVSKEFKYNSNFDLFGAPVTNWRDTFSATIAPIPPKPEELPSVCRDILLEYTNRVMELGATLFELLSEAIGLEPNHLKDLGCTEGLLALGHYYPACPQPEITPGTSKHADNDFLTVLLQDDIGGLQVRHQNHWVDVPPVPGALVVNIGDMLQASVTFYLSYHLYYFESFSVRFTGKNFSSWEFQFQLFVTGKELWGHIDGADPAPTDRTKLGEWKIKDARVMTWLLDPTKLMEVSNLRPYKTANAM